MNRRVDRKYVLSKESIAAVLAACAATYQLLTIQNQYVFDYHTWYYDTPEYSLYHHHHQGKAFTFLVARQHCRDRQSRRRATDGDSTAGQYSLRAVHAQTTSQQHPTQQRGCDCGDDNSRSAPAQPSNLTCRDSSTEQADAKAQHGARARRHRQGLHPPAHTTAVPAPGGRAPVPCRAGPAGLRRAARQTSSSI